eukprot:scaffold3568_cov380-Prasinococcus_capsulatus_cf.AAC.1
MDPAVGRTALCGGNPTRRNQARASLPRQRQVAPHPWAPAAPGFPAPVTLQGRPFLPSHGKARPAGPRPNPGSIVRVARLPRGGAP